MQTMIAPDQSIGEVPEERVAEAEKLGFSRAVRMKSPNGKEQWMPYSQVGLALDAGFKLVIE
jgi:hypothetical protein